MKIYALQTGQVQVKRTHRQLRGPAGARLLSIAVDPRWTDWLPIHCWVVEHPDGLIVVDTGETAQINDGDYVNCDPGTAFVYRNLLRFRLSREDEIDQQMARLGLDVNDVRWVVQTHLHSDHMGGMRHFPKAEFIVPRADYPNSQGTLPCRYPDWLKPTFPSFVPERHFGFANTMRLTDNVLIVPTPGHSVGHQSVIVVEDERDVMLAGDVAFDAGQLLQQQVAGISAEVPAAKQSLATVLDHCRQRPTVFLPSHDLFSAERLQKRSVIVASP